MLAALELSTMIEMLHLLKSPANARKLLAAMARADELEETDVESQSVEQLLE